MGLRLIRGEPSIPIPEHIDLRDGYVWVIEGVKSESVRRAKIISQLILNGIPCDSRYWHDWEVGFVEVFMVPEECLDEAILLLAFEDLIDT